MRAASPVQSRMLTDALCTSVLAATSLPMMTTGGFVLGASLDFRTKRKRRKRLDKESEIYVCCTYYPSLDIMSKNASDIMQPILQGRE
mmetsp:Transcript_21291/g.43672  ORF Transcript_21291/g.43672 Transcript_21291/m.43672 type:complete len:88 (-) Transcript_21291:541-804(-)